MSSNLKICYKNLILIILLSVTSTACHQIFNNKDYREAVKAKKDGEFSKAIEIFLKIIKKNENLKTSLEASREGGDLAIFKTKDYQKALEFYRFILLNTNENKEKIQAQIKIAAIYFENIADYENSIAELHKLLDLPISLEEKITHQFSIAKAYYYLHQFFQAGTEADILLSLDTKQIKKFETLILKANIYKGQKDIEKAIEVYKSIIKEFPERSEKEFVLLNLSVCYEEIEKYNEAISILVKMRDSYPKPEFIDVKIKRLKERQSFLPGAKGLKR